MYYTNILILVILLLTGCAQTDTVREPSNHEKEQDSQTTDAEIQLYRQAITDLNEGKLEQAEKILSDFTNTRPQLAGPWANLGLVYLKKDQLSKAEENLNQAYKRNPHMPQVNNLLGVIENRKGHIKKAEKLYLTAIQYKPDYVLAHYNLALLYDTYLQDIKKAITHYQRYLELIDNKDQKTRDWLEQLENSVK